MTKETYGLEESSNNTHFNPYKDTTIVKVKLPVVHLPAWLHFYVGHQDHSEVSLSALSALTTVNLDL